MLKDMNQTFPQPKKIPDKSSPHTNQEFYTTVQEVKNLLENGMVEEALDKYNTLKQTYLHLTQNMDSLKEKEELYADLKDAFAAVNIAIAKDHTFLNVTTTK